MEFRYGSNEMRRIFERKNILRKYVEVEAALMEALEHENIVPKGCHKKLLETLDKIKPEDIDSLEKKTGHDIASFTILLAEALGDCGKYVHLGFTSYDIVDTVWALLIRDALAVVKNRLVKLIEELMKLSMKYKDTVMVGRTHGQHALPITFGFKLANYVYELSRSLERILDSEKRTIKCKCSGAVGTMAAWNNKGLNIEYIVCSSFNLRPHEITTQVAPRDGFAELICNLSILASQLDRLALEFRELSRPEISEIALLPTKIGSSTMPHKRNPAVAERVSGLAKVARSLAIVALENIPLMHERDLTNSSSERILIPHMFLIIDQMLLDILKTINTIHVNIEAMVRNLNLLKGVIASECLMVKLVLKTNMPRHKAHELLSQLANKALSDGRNYLDVILESNISSLLPRKDIEECFNYSSYLGEYEKLISRTLSYAKKLLKEVEKC